MRSCPMCRRPGTPIKCRPSYTYELSGYPQVETPYAARENDSWIYPTKSERRVYLTGAEGGFLFQNAGAAAA